MVFRRHHQVNWSWYWSDIRWYVRCSNFLRRNIWRRVWSTAWWQIMWSSFSWLAGACLKKFATHKRKYLSQKLHLFINRFHTSCNHCQHGMLSMAMAMAIVNGNHCQHGEMFFHLTKYYATIFTHFIDCFQLSLTRLVSIYVNVS